MLANLAEEKMHRDVEMLLEQDYSCYRTLQVMPLQQGKVFHAQ